MITLYNTDAITEICTLNDCLECLVTEEENGLFELELTYSISSNNFSDIQNNRVVKAKASDELGEQLFRIYYISNEISGKIYVKAQHITYDLIDNFVENITCTKSTCQESFQAMLLKCEYEHNFKGYSDIEHTTTYNLSRVNPLEAILGTKGSLLDIYGNGAKLKRDNYNIYLNKTRGNNNGVTIAYSKNITGYKREIDETDVITCIYPFAKVQTEIGEGDNVSTIEETIVLPERFVNSKYINNYPHAKILAVDYSEREVKDIASLRTLANKYFKETNKDIPNVNYKVEFVYLHQAIEYQTHNLKALELVGMGDTVTVIDERIGMNVEANVIKTVFNVLTNRYESIELGRFKGSINNIIGDLETSVDNALNQVNNMYTNFEVLDDKIVSEVSKLEGDIKSSTSLWQQEANSITSTVKDLSGKYTQLKQTVDGFDLTGMVTFRDLSTKGYTTINGSNITTGTINGDRISGGTIEGSLLQTYAGDSSRGVRIAKESMQLNNTAFFYDSNFNIQCKEGINIGAMQNIYLMAGLNSNGYQSGYGEVVVPSATLRVQKLNVVNNTTLNSLTVSSSTSLSSTSASSLSVSGTSSLGAVTASRLTVSGNAMFNSGNIYVDKLTSINGSALWFSYSNNVIYAGRTLNMNGYTITGQSDRRLKENISYIDRIKSETNLKDAFYNDFKNKFKFATYNYKKEDQKDKTHFGFIAQDIENTSFSDYILVDGKDENNEDILCYDVLGIINVYASILQKEIELRDNQIDELSNRLTNLEKLLNIGSDN
jgi:phage minor structural protein